MSKTTMLFDLEPDDESNYKTATVADKKTLLGKKNTVMISDPLCTAVKKAGPGTLLTKEMKDNFKDFDFYEVRFVLTLLPDEKCRFRSVDFLMNINSPATGKPIFLALDPMSLSSKKAIKVSTNDQSKFGVGENALKITASVEGGDSREESYEKFESTIAGLGKMTPSAGWRLKMTDSQEIALCSPDLVALVAVPNKKKATINFTIAAKVEVKDELDKFLSMLFFRKPTMKAEGDYQFPK